MSIALSLKRMADSREELTKRAKYDSVITNLQIALKNEREAKLCDDHRALAIWSAKIDFFSRTEEKYCISHVVRRNMVAVMSLIFVSLSHTCV